VTCKPLLVKSGIEGGGSIVSCASMSAFRAVPVVPGYGAGKAGLVQMTLNMGVAWARDNVRANAVAPGLIETGMTSIMKSEAMKEVEAAELARVPMGRWGTPEDVAPTFLFLASPAARFIVGQTFNVDGGFSGL
jgi:NAD(P)-dependent dehydrogenase (short-subunit alcohol dehydrogenase family)